MSEEGKDKRRSSVFGRLIGALKSTQSGPTSATVSDNKLEVQSSQAPVSPSLASPSGDTQGESAVANRNPKLSEHTYSVQGKTAIVTGAGINYCFAKLLLSKGCNVLIADLTLRSEAQDLLDVHSKDDSHPRAHFVKTDVTDWGDLHRMFSAAYTTFGALDIVCPGAGVFEPHWSNFWHPPGSTQSKDAVDSGHYKTMDINVTHPIRTTQIAIAEFLNPTIGDKASIENPKRIVHISSIAGQVFGLPTPLYIASKWAISGFVRSLGGLDSTLGIKVTAVAPGIVKTPLFTEHPEKLKMIDQENDVWVTPDEVAEAMLVSLEDANIPSGSIVEVGSEYTRVVQPFNDPGPMGRPGVRTGHGSGKVDEVYEWLATEGWGKGGLK